MIIGIIDAEIMGKSSHRFPNLVCMKLSAYYKEQGHAVYLCTDYDKIDCFDKVFISKVFIKTNIPCEPENGDKNETNVVEYYSNNEFLKNPKISYGGTGFYYEKAPRLDPEIEHHMPDYHLYDEWVAECIGNGVKKKEFEMYTDYSIGFLTRGCFRQCQFCVNRVYKKCAKHSPLSEFYDPERKKICLLDDNFLACPDWKELIAEVKATGKRFVFKQGLDERLLTEDKIEEMNTWNYDGKFIFAFDNVADADVIVPKLELLKKLKYGKVFYCFCGYDREGKYDEEFWKNDIENLFKRIKWLQENGCCPYIMRHENYKNSPYEGIYITASMFYNSFSLAHKMSFNQYCEKRVEQGRPSNAKYRDIFASKYPEIAKKYFYENFFKSY